MSDPIQLTCSQCNRPFADRKRDTCAYCGAPIPVEARMNAGQKQEMENLKEEEYKSYRKWKEAAKAKDSSKNLGDSD